MIREAAESPTCAVCESVEVFEGRQEDPGVEVVRRNEIQITLSQEKVQPVLRDYVRDINPEVSHRAEVRLDVDYNGKITCTVSDKF